MFLRHNLTSDGKFKYYLVTCQVLLDSVMPDSARSPIQERAHATRERLLQAAIASFASAGYEASSTRNIEEAAGVKRGLIRYHFGSKESLWKAATQWMFEHANSELLLAAQQGADLSPVPKLRSYVRAFVRFSAHHPEINRLMIREGMDDDWRLDWLTENFVQPWYNQLEEVFLKAKNLVAVPNMEFANFYYILIGAATLIFSMAPEARRIANIDPTDEDTITAHADALTSLLFPSTMENA